MTLRINEIFETIQGEATHTGRPSIFVRLQGCPVGCAWCDTKHTWTTDPNNEVSFASMLRKQADAPQYASCTEEELLNHLHSYTARHVVFTGGEPALYDLRWITHALHAMGFTTQIETSGTHALKVDDTTWVTVSPKVGMPGGFDVFDDVLLRADEIKHPVGKQRDVDQLCSLMDRQGLASLRAKPIWLQPLSLSPSATRLCVQSCTRNNWRLSLQTHKFIGVR